MKYNLKRIMQNAWRNYRKQAISFAEALHRAWLSAKAEAEEISDGSIANTMKHIGTFSRYDKVPENIWNARICEIKAEAADMVAVVIEGAVAVI